MLPLCSWAGTWYLAILVIFSLLLASENWRAGFWISLQQNNPPPPAPLLWFTIYLWASWVAVEFSLLSGSCPSDPHPTLSPPPPFSVPCETCFHIDSLPAAFDWPIPCTLRRPHEPWRDLSQFFCSKVSTDCCLTVQEGPGYLRTVFSHSSCHVPNIQWAVSYPLEKATCVFEEGTSFLSSCLSPRLQLTTSLFLRNSSCTVEGSLLAFLPCPQLLAGFCLALSEDYFSL